MNSPLAVGVDFDNLELLKQTCCTWAVRETFEYKTVRANKTRYEIACKADGCLWRLAAASVGGAGNIFRIKRYTSNHSCVGIGHPGHQQVSAKFIRDWILEKVKQQPQYRPSHIVQDIKLEFGVVITYSKALRAKDAALVSIYGTHEDAMP